MNMSKPLWGFAIGSLGTAAYLKPEEFSRAFFFKQPSTHQLDDFEHNPAYVYGRLLSVFEQIQYAALGDVNANVVDKFYATMSSVPAMVVGRLQDNARNHLRKLRGEKPGAFVLLERRLIDVLGLLGALAPPQRLSLQDQGLFALGYYHEKARQFEEAAGRKAEKAKPEKARNTPELENHT